MKRDAESDRSPRSHRISLPVLLFALALTPLAMASGSAAPQVKAVPHGIPILDLDLGPVNPQCQAIVQLLCMYDHPATNETWLCYVYNRPVVGDHLIDGCTHI